MNAILIACFVYAQSQTPAHAKDELKDHHLNVCSALEVASWAHEHKPSLMMAIAWRESGFELDAVSSAGCVGLMQVMPRFSPFSVRELKTLQGGVNGGMTAVSYWKRTKGDVWLHCYNSGNHCKSDAYVEEVLEIQDQITGLRILFTHLPGLAPVL